jgi:hypothetical protein
MVEKQEVRPRTLGLVENLGERGESHEYATDRRVPVSYLKAAVVPPLGQGGRGDGLDGLYRLSRNRHPGSLPVNFPS